MDLSNLKCIDLDGYQEITTSNLKGSKGGGVGIIVSMDLKQTFIKSLAVPSFEFSNV